MRTSYELAHVVQTFGAELTKRHTITNLQQKVLHNILVCRTSILGGHEEVCLDCGTVRYSYNSCGNRHCPKCQAAKQAFWIDDLIHTTLPTKHYHIVFTLPHELNAICLYNSKMFYEHLFSAVWNTLRTFFYTHYGVEGGAICVLHTWGQNLSLHPHIHCIVPAAGYSLQGAWKTVGAKSGSYLFPVHQLSALFLGKFLDSVKRSLRKQNVLPQFNHILEQSYSKKSVVHCEPSLASSAHVVKYLGQYTHRVAITNSRIVNIKNSAVTFIAKDYKDNAVKKPITLDGVEFLRRFCLHILPHRFVKIRRYGIYNHTTKRNLNVQFVPEEKPDIDCIIKQKQAPETSQERFARLTGFDVCLCSVCKIGRMIRVRELPRIRSPSMLSTSAIEQSL